MEEHENNPSIAEDQMLYLRTANGEEYGPADLATVREWCKEGRIGPDQVASVDQQQWISVTDFPELPFDWLLILADGTAAGPFPMAVLEEQEGNLPPDSICRNRHTGEERPTSDLSMPEAVSPSYTDTPEDTLFAEHSVSEETSAGNISGSDPDQPAEVPTEQDHPRQEKEEPESSSKEEDLPLSIRLETVSRHAAEAREQLTETRAALQGLRQEHTLLQDENQHLKETLAATESERDVAQQNLLEAENRTAQNEAELDNQRAQVTQLQEQYEKIQLENQRQFEQIDDLRASALTNEQAWKREMSILQAELESKDRVLAEIASVLGQELPPAPQSRPSTPAQPSSTNVDAPQPPPKAAGIMESPPPASPERPPKPPPVSSPPPPRKKKPNTAIAAALILLLIGLLAWGLFAMIFSAMGTHDEQAETNNASRQEVAETQDETPENALVLQPEQVRGQEQRNQTNTVQDWPEIHIPRATVTKDDLSLQLTFDYGLFRTNTSLREEAKEDLAALAEQLRGDIQRFSIIVEGHTDAIPVSPDNERFVDNFSLGMARAEAVKFFLSDDGNLPAGHIHTASAGQSSPPYPNDSSENRARNRTVTISITAR